MKKLRIINCLVLTLLLVVTGCFEEREPLTKTWVAFEEESIEQVESNSTPVEVTILYSGTLQSSDITLAYTISSPDGAVEGSDYELSETSGTAIIPAGAASVSIDVIELLDNNVLDGQRSVVLTLEDAEGLTLGFPGPDGLKKSIAIVIIDDDCAIPNLVGQYKVVNRNASPGACGDPANDDQLTYDAEITLVSDDGNGKFTYSVSDVTGGLYALCYGDGENPGEIETDGLDIELIDQPDVVYGGDFFNGSGRIECNGNFTLTWSNGFGDKGTSYYTKVN